MLGKLIRYHDRICTLNTRFTHDDFTDIPIEDTPMGTVFYCDPPYLITMADYNRQWNEERETMLLSVLDHINDSGRRFALSNCITTNGRRNTILNEWLMGNDYHVRHLTMDYGNANYQRHVKSHDDTDEILVMNY